jgi:hypothetical protein
VVIKYELPWFVVRQELQLLDFAPNHQGAPKEKKEEAEAGSARALLT